MNKRTLGYILILFCSLLFSSFEASLKRISGVFAPMQITTIRFAAAGLLLIPMAVRSIRKKGEKLAKKDIPALCLNGFMLICVGMVAYQVGISYTKASVIALIVCLNPLFVTVLAHFILKEPIHNNHIAALFLELAAVAVMIDLFSAHTDRFGLICGLITTLCFSVYSIIGRKYSVKYGGSVVTCAAFLSGSFGLLALVLLGRTAAVGAVFGRMGLDFFVNVPLFQGIPSFAIPALVYNCVVLTAAGNVAQMISIEYTSAQEASLIYFLKPAFAPFFALFMLKEEITRSMVIGIIIFVIGAAVSVLPGFFGHIHIRHRAVHI